MAQEFQSPAWLERECADRIVIAGSCSIGRTPSNHLVLVDDKVSRRHAIVHSQGQGEFWLVDLGSSNGTYLNEQRVTQPSRLRDHDQISIGSFRLTFRQPDAAATVRTTHDSDKTIAAIQSSTCWLLVADIESSTQLQRELSPEELPLVTGRWFDTCKRILDASGGAIDKYLGDGFFAYWPAETHRAGDVARAIEGLKKMQAAAQLAFRVVLHHGRVCMGGLPTMGGARLFGPEVNFTFRMERLASTLGTSCLLSAAAQVRLPQTLIVASLGRHALPGFDGEFAFFKL